MENIENDLQAHKDSIPVEELKPKMKAPDNDVNKLAEEITVDDFRKAIDYNVDDYMSRIGKAAEECYNLALKMVTAASNKTATGIYEQIPDGELRLRSIEALVSDILHNFSHQEGTIEPYNKAMMIEKIVAWYKSRPELSFPASGKWSDEDMRKCWDYSAKYNTELDSEIQHPLNREEYIQSIQSLPSAGERETVNK